MRATLLLLNINWKHIYSSSIFISDLFSAFQSSVIRFWFQYFWLIYDSLVLYLSTHLPLTTLRHVIILLQYNIYHGCIHI